ncbi:restriction endonuclease [Bacillus inaquosorum]|uniref:restriction endonuclease n=1 Tax=Bacillus inaquosorum TaxID=483913 RepID=UPI00228129A8|nr:restriction endonuclease [Bacillus inaquosorum]MCY7949365.1 restriction endonuclease [Bacillus inaquosorum]MEC0520498.1 restriction endonuclease [Bacillus inaquosorum]MEC0607301.1 restriction endonuclease [Bacillus inaquosorum]
MNVDNEISLTYKDYAESLGYIISMKNIEGGKRVLFDTSPNSPIGVRLDITGEDLNNHFLWIYIRTSSWNFNGERSDLHELISSIVAITLKGLKDITVSMLDVDNPSIEHIEGEVYARVLTFERDKLINFNSDQESDKKIANILHGVIFAAYILDVELDYILQNKKNNSSNDENLLSKLATFLGEDSESFHLSRRREPEWSWCKSINLGMSIFSLNKKVINFLKSEVLLQKYDVIKGINREIVKSKKYYNSISYSRFELGTDVLKYLEGRSNEKVTYIVLENGFFVFGERHFIFLEDECGNNSTNTELDELKSNFNNLRSSLFPNIQFYWEDKIDGGRFEELTRDLLIEEDDVSRVRLISTGNDSDGGRDLEIEIYVFNQNNLQIFSPYRKIKVLVQCKAYKKSVNKGNVTDIRDTIENYNAQGYFLVVSSSLTSPLHDHLSSMREKGVYWIDWWTRKEIEDRLTDNLSIAKKYQDIVTYSLN